jgi:DNA-binding NarL/FixJ family response regulator
MTQVVRFDERVWGRLASMADNGGTTIPELLEQAVSQLLVGTTRAAADKEARYEELLRSREAHHRRLVSEVLRLRANGHTIQAIADITRYSKTYVSKILCDNGARTWSRSDAGQRQGRKEAA